MVAAATLYTRILRRADLEDSSYVESGDLQDICLEAYLELHDILCSVLGTEAPLLREEYTTTASNDLVVLPSADDIHRIARIDFQDASGNWSPLVRGVLGSDVMDGMARTWRRGEDITYIPSRQVREGPGTTADWNLYFQPIPDGVYTFRVWYIPGPAIEFSGATVSTYPDEYPEFVVAYACAELAHRQEIDAVPFENARERIRARIERYGRPHQLTQSHRAADVRSLQVPKKHSFWQRG